MDVNKLRERLLQVVAGGKSDEQERRLAPLVVMARLDAELQPTHEELLRRFPDGIDQDSAAQRGRVIAVTGRPYYNLCPYTLESLLNDKSNLLVNLRAYVGAFSPEVRRALTNLKAEAVIDHLRKHKRLVPAVEALRDLSKELGQLDGLAMTRLFDQLAIETIAANNEDAYEAITPRDVVRLVVRLTFAPHLDALQAGPIGIDLYDPAFGSGGMLFHAAGYLKSLNPNLRLTLRGNERSDTTHALGVANIFASEVLGKRDTVDLADGNTLLDAGRSMRPGHYVLCNPPYGETWKDQKASVEREAAEPESRFAPGQPSSSDGQMLFLLQALAKLSRNDGLGHRAVVVSNGSPLFTGQAGSGPSNIRGHLLENDWLDALIAMPENLFFNTGITTYLWVIDKSKPADRKDRVLLIDARGTTPGDPTTFVHATRRSQGDKRYAFEDAGIERLVEVYQSGSGPVKWTRPTDFKFRRVTVERPTYLRFRHDDDPWMLLTRHSEWMKLASDADDAKRRKGEARQQALLELLQRLHGAADSPAELLGQAEEEANGTRYAFEGKTYKLGWTKGMRAAVLGSLLEASPGAFGEPLRDPAGALVPNADLRDYENVPWDTDVDDYMLKEVLPHVPDAWVSEECIGWEIPFTRLFYTYEPPRPLRDIQADIREVRQEIDTLFKELDDLDAMF